MSTLSIRDLARQDELSRNEMSAVRGGFSLFPMPLIDASKFSVQNAAQQFTQQSQNTYVSTGVNDFDVKNIHANVAPSQSSSNTNTLNVFSPSV
jgi:hypothetical protein